MPIPMTRSRGIAMRALLLAATPLAGAAAPSARPVELSGRVVDSLGMPVTGVPVFLRVVTDEAAMTPTWSVRSLDSADRRVGSSGPDGRFRVTLQQPRIVVVSLALSERDVRGILVDPVVTRSIPTLRVGGATQRLPHISVSARSPNQRAAIPGATTSIGSDQLQARAPITVAEALRTVPGVLVADEDPYGLALNIGMRGLAPRRSSRTLLLEDGMPILLGPYGDPSMHYAPPLESLERIEVVKGSGQVMNGPQTLAGVINFVTVGPRSAARSAELTMGAGALDFRNAHVRVGASDATRGIGLELTQRSGAGLRAGEAHRVQHVAISARTTLADAHVLSLKLARWREASRTSESGLTEAEFDAAPFSLPFDDRGRFDVDRGVAQLTHVSSLGRVVVRTNTYVSRTTRASWRQSGESGERLGNVDYSDAFSCAPQAVSYRDCGNQGRPRTYGVLGLEPRVEVTLGSPQRGVQLDGGLRLYAESVRRRQFVGGAPTAREADAQLTSDNGIESRVVAGFAQSRVFLGQLSITPALRVERVLQDVRNHFPGSEAAMSQAYTQLLPGIGVSLSPGAALTVFAGAHRGFAPPRPADLYRPLPGQSVVLVDPETSLNLELGSRITPRPGVQVEATLFQMGFENEIIEAPANVGQRFINGGRTVHAGVELAAQATLPALAAMAPDISLRASYTFLPTARFRSGGLRDPQLVGNRLPYAPRHLATSSATYARGVFSMGASVEFVGAQFADPANRTSASEDGQAGVLPAYTVTGAFGSYALPVRGWELRASVRNLFDRLYITQRNEGIITGARRLARAELHWRY
jgi:Fe(3+) dicitrate transport protein